MNRPSAAPQPLRATPGNVYANQQTAGARTGTLGSARLPNGKLAATGSGSWGFPSVAGTPVLPTQQPRSTSSNLTSFAQSIGSSQSPHTPLDLSEFPSLSGAPQAQQQASASQAIWGNAPVRAPQNPSTRPANSNASIPSISHTIRPPSQALHHQSQRQSDTQEGRTSPFPQLGPGNDDFSFGSGNISQATRETERHGPPDDFPPLGGLGSGGLGQLRRTAPAHEGQANGGSNGDAFGSIQSQSRSSVPRPSEAQQDSQPQSSTSERRYPPLDGSSRASPMSRSPLEALNGEQEGLQGPEQSLSDRIIRNSATGGPAPSQSSRMPFRGNGEQPQDRFPQSQLQSHDLGSEPHMTDQVQIPQMTEVERFGIKGLQAILDGAYGADQASLAQGIDLNLLGLDLNRNSPLSTDWAGPFADPTGRPIIPEFTLPPAYTVQNVPSLHEKIGSFSDETLFMIFYQFPRDELQELAANELYNRDWRWHKKLSQWMMKAKEYGEPVLSQSRQEERGIYYFWNANDWRRDRREFILSYEHLHHAQSLPSQGVTPL